MYVLLNACNNRQSTWSSSKSCEKRIYTFSVCYVALIEKATTNRMVEHIHDDVNQIMKIRASYVG